MDDITLLTIGLVVFAAAQVIVQVRAESTRRIERQADHDEEVDRAFHLAWAEHFRLDALADQLKKRDLVELTILGVLRPEDVLPRDWTAMTGALSALGREAGYLGGVASTLAHDLSRQIAIYIGSVRAFGKDAPVGTDAERVDWIRTHYGEDLAPWEKSIRDVATQLSLLMWDACIQNPRASVLRQLNFSDNVLSDFAKKAVAALVKRSKETGTLGPGAS